MDHKVGDFVRIKIEEDKRQLKLVRKNERFPPDEDKCYFTNVQICGCYQMSSKDYIVLIDFDPHRYFSFKIEQWHQKGYDVRDCFLGMKGAYIHEDHIWVVAPPAPTKQVILNQPGGTHCKLCKKFIQYAGTNRDDGTFVCRRCVQSKGHTLTCKPIKN